MTDGAKSTDVMVRVDRDLYKQVADFSTQEGKTVKRIAKEALIAYLTTRQVPINLSRQPEPAEQAA